MLLSDAKHWVDSDLEHIVMFFFPALNVLLLRGNHHVIIEVTEYRKETRLSHGLDAAHGGGWRQYTTETFIIPSPFLFLVSRHHGFSSPLPRKAHVSHLAPLTAMAIKVPSFLLPSILLFLLLSAPAIVHSSYPLLDSQLSDPISDGVTSRGPRYPPFLRLPRSASLSSSDSCEETYGFMPCTSTWLGNLFLIIVYGYLMYLAATFLSNGSELLLEIMGPGIVGGLFLPMLGALPDAMLILGT